MKALVYHGPGKKSWDDVPDPQVIDSTDAIIGVDVTTICGTDLHILKGDVPTAKPDRFSAMRLSGNWRPWAPPSRPCVQMTGCWSPA